MHSFSFPNYLIVEPNSEFAWPVPMDRVTGIQLLQGQGKIDGVPVAQALSSLSYGKRYLYEGNSPMVVAYELSLGSPEAVMLNSQHAAPYPDQYILKPIRKRVSEYTSNGRVLFAWQIQGEAIGASLLWENLDPLVAGVGIGLIASQRARIQTLDIATVPYTILLAGPPEVTASVTEGRTQMNWYATGTRYSLQPLS